MGRRPELQRPAHRGGPELRAVVPGERDAATRRCGSSSARAAAPYRTTFEQSAAPLTGELTTYTFPFTANLSFPADGAAPGQLAFHLGKSTPYDFCISDVSLRTTAAPPPPYEPETGPRVRVNQVGYLPEGPKRATLVTDAAAALPWELHDAADAVVATGDHHAGGRRTTRPELGVHIIDFSDVTAPGTGYTLVADGETSHPFDIDAEPLPAAAPGLARLLLPRQRSGTPIDGAIVGDEYARAAGHLGVAPNQGDTAVPCIGPRDYYDGWTCDYTLDVPAAGTTPATTASTSSTAASPWPSCSAPTSAR